MRSACPVTNSVSSLYRLPSPHRSHPLLISQPTFLSLFPQVPTPGSGKAAGSKKENSPLSACLQGAEAAVVQQQRRLKQAQRQKPTAMKLATETELVMAMMTTCVLSSVCYCGDAARGLPFGGIVIDLRSAPLVSLTLLIAV